MPSRPSSKSSREHQSRTSKAKLPSETSSSSSHKKSYNKTTKSRENAVKNTFADIAFEKFLLESHGLQVYSMRGDGNCLFRSIAHQLYGDQEYNDNSSNKHIEIRMKIVDYMEAHEELFKLFMEDDVKFEDYVAEMRQVGVWGGYQELYAAAQVFRVKVMVFQWEAPKYVINPDSLAPNEIPRMVLLSYHGECHFNSVLPTATGRSGISENNTPNDGTSSQKDTKCMNNSSSSSSSSVHVTNIQKAVPWCSEEEILLALEWSDQNSEDAIELLCSDLKNIRIALHKVTTKDNEDISVQSTTEETEQVADKDSTRQETKKFSKVKLKSVIKIPKDNNQRVLSKKELRQKEKQNKMKDSQQINNNPQIISDNSTENDQLTSAMREIHI